jgi:hypothetical protein
MTTTFIRLAVLYSLLQLSASARAAEPPAPAPAADPDAATRNRDIQNKLSTLWTMVSLNMIGADVLSSYIPGKQAEIVRFAGGEKNVKYYMLGGAVIYQIPISMIFLSRYLPRHVNRWVNVAASVLSAAAIVGAGSSEPHYIFAATAEILTLSYITWTSLRWPDDRPTRAATRTRHRLAWHLNRERGSLSYSFRF